MDDLKDILSPEDYEELKLVGLVDKIESGDYMPDYLDWLAVNRPELYLNWPHVQLIGEYIQKLVDGKIRRLMVSLHPRVGKSTIITTSLPTYMLAKNPRTKIVLAAHTATLANKFSVQCRSFTERVGIVLNPNKRARDEWEVLDYGGGVRAVGCGTGISGWGSDLTIVDDPIKSRKDASSKAIKESHYEWYKSDIFTRFDTPTAAMVMIATRWAEDDLFGTILENEGEWSPENPNGWHVLNLPAICDSEDDPLGRKIGDALCPDKFSLEQLLQIKQVLGHDFHSLYQGKPQSREGGVVKKKWFKYIEHIPKDEYGYLEFIRFWDKASSPEVTADHTAGVLMAYSRKTSNIYILDAQQFKLSTYERDQRMLQIAREDHIKYGDVRIRFEIEPGSSGKDSEAATIKLFQGYSIRGIRPRTNKLIRFEPFVSQLEGGFVYLRKADWNREYITTLSGFPNYKNDDLVDATSGAYNEIVGGNSFIRIGGKI